MLPIGGRAISDAVEELGRGPGRRVWRWWISLAMNVASPADKVGTKDPLSAGILDEVLDATIVAPFNDLPAVEAELEASFDLGYHFKHVDAVFDRVFGAKP